MSRGSREATTQFENSVGHIRDRVIINESQEITSGGVFLSLNGYAFNAVPGKEVDIPRPVRLMLDTRIRSEPYYDERNKLQFRDIKRFTYTLVKAGVNLNPDGTVNESYLDIKEDNAS